MCVNTIQPGAMTSYTWKGRRKKSRWTKRWIWDRQNLNRFLTSLPVLKSWPGISAKEQKGRSWLCNNYVSAMIAFRQGGKLPIPKGTLRLRSPFHHFLCRKGGEMVPRLGGWGEVPQLAEEGLHRTGPHSGQAQGSSLLQPWLCQLYGKPQP